MSTLVLNASYRCSVCGRCHNTASRIGRQHRTFAERAVTTVAVEFSPDYLRANGWGWILGLAPAEQERCFADLENDLRDEKDRLERENSYEDDGPGWRRNRARLIEIDELLGAAA